MSESILPVSPEEAVWCRCPVTSNPDAGQRLAAEVIICAVEEYRALSKIGQIVDGRVPPGCLTGPNDGRIKKPFMKYFLASDVMELIEFFHSSQLERWLDYAHFNVTGAAIRERLGISRNPGL